MNLNQVTLPADNMTASISFYQLLGLELIVHTHERYARFVCPDGRASLSLHLVDQPRTSVSISIYFECDDLDNKVDRLIDKGIIVDQMPTDTSWLWREARLFDPYGNLIILYFAGENRINPPWKIAKVSTV